jgi:hypothetical protein
MPSLVAILIAVVLGFWLLKFLIRAAFHIAVARSPNTQKRALEREVREDADWFGTTGLDEATERELPRYLRRELGEYLDDPEGLKAADLKYLGVLTDERGSAHFWSMPARHGEQSFAYVDIDASGAAASTGWGDRGAPGGVQSSDS